MRSLILTILLSLLSYPSHAGKPVVGISGIQTAAQNISCKGWEAATGHNCNSYLSEGFRVMLETAIVKSGKMDVMERAQVDVVLGEQGLGQMNLTTSGGEMGGLTGVDYMIYGSITKFGARKEGFAISGGSSGVGGLLGGKAATLFGGGVGTASVHTEMGVDLKVTDVATGRIILADTVEGEAKTGEAFTVAGISRSSSTGDPFSDVQRIVASNLAEAVATLRVPFKIIKIMKDGALVINYGNAFLAPGDVLAMFDVGEKIVDPDTGETLGAEITETGMVEITMAEAKFSKAVGLSGVPTVGAVLKRPSSHPGRSAGRERSGSDFFEDDSDKPNTGSPR